MKCILMNKNTEVASIEIDTNYNIISKIYEIYNIDYAPLSLKNAYKDKSESELKTLNKWYKGRGIPSWRKDIENLLEKLKINSPDELLNKAYGLSLSDQYWFKEENQNLKWENINFFTNDFEYKGYLNISLSSSYNENVSLHSPNNTTDGMLQKAWIIENGKRVLVKGTYSLSRQEPINEWLVSEICDRLNLDYCKYYIDIIDNKLVSKCEDFITDNEEIITASDIFKSENKANDINDFTHYINILEQHGVKNARENVENMFFIDFLVMNFDRHMKNFGVIRNVETLRWERATPIFDTGECMECNKTLNEINFNDGTGKFFTNTSKKFSTYLENINTNRFDISKLNDLPNIYKEKLIKYREYTDISDERIEKLVTGLKYRISKIAGN